MLHISEATFCPKLLVMYCPLWELPSYLTIPLLSLLCYLQYTNVKVCEIVVVPIDVVGVCVLSSDYLVSHVCINTVFECPSPNGESKKEIICTLKHSKEGCNLVLYYDNTIRFTNVVSKVMCIFISAKLHLL